MDSTGRIGYTQCNMCSAHGLHIDPHEIKVTNWATGLGEPPYKGGLYFFMGTSPYLYPDLHNVIDFCP